MFLAKAAKILHRLVWILSSVVAFDRPKLIVEAGEMRVVFFDDSFGTLEINLLPITKMRDDFDHTPAAVARRTRQRIRIVTAKNDAREFVGKCGERRENGLATA